MAGQFILKTVSPEVVTGNRQPLYIGGTDPLGTDGVIVVGADGVARIGEQPIANSSIVQLKNWIINGQFDIWQRATSQTSSGYGSDDRWLNVNSVSIKTHSQQPFVTGQTNVPNNPTYFSRTIVTSGNTANSIVVKSQLIENVTKFSGKTLSLSFWAKADASKNLSIELLQNFGVGGSAFITEIGIQKFSLTTSWQRFTKTVSIPSISGKTIGANNYLELIFWFDAGYDYGYRTDSLGNQSGTFDIANVCLVEGSIPQECPSEPYAEVLRKCQRYYEMASDLHPSSWGGTDNYYRCVAHNFITQYLRGVEFCVPKRIVPTVVFFDKYGVSGQVSDGATTKSIVAAGINKNAIARIVLSASLTSTDNFWSWTADAEL